MISVNQSISGLRKNKFETIFRRIKSVCLYLNADKLQRVGFYKQKTDCYETKICNKSNYAIHVISTHYRNGIFSG